MTEKISDIQEFFDNAVKIKEERGVNYDNDGKSAYDTTLYPYDEGEKFIGGIWPVSQKHARLTALAHNANHGNFDPEAMNDTLLDLVNYAAMFWVRFVKPNLQEQKQEPEHEPEQEPEHEQNEIVIPKDMNEGIDKRG